MKLWVETKRESIFGLKLERSLAVRARHWRIRWRMEGKSRRNGHGLVVWAIFATYPRATIDKSSAGFSESWTWRRRRNFPLPWISSSCGHSELNEALSHSCRIVSHESWFCRKSPGTLLLCFYWRFMINQRREVLAKLWKQKNHSIFPRVCLLWTNEWNLYGLTWNWSGGFQRYQF